MDHKAPSKSNSFHSAWRSSPGRTNAWGAYCIASLVIGWPSQPSMARSSSPARPGSMITPPLRTELGGNSVEGCLGLDARSYLLALLLAAGILASGHQLAGGITPAPRLREPGLRVGADRQLLLLAVDPEFDPSQISARRLHRQEQAETVAYFIRLISRLSVPDCNICQRRDPRSFPSSWPPRGSQPNCPKCLGPVMWHPRVPDAAGRIGTFSDDRRSKSLGFPRVL